MKDLDAMIERFLEEERRTDGRPAWAEEILEEIVAIRRLLESEKECKRREEYRRFLGKLRKRLRANPARGIYPKIRYGGGEYGVDARGSLYELATQRDLSAREAFEIYEFLFEKRENLWDVVKGISL
jgi:hypothetical protein